MEQNRFGEGVNYLKFGISRLLAEEDKSVPASNQVGAQATTSSIVPTFQTESAEESYRVQRAYWQVGLGSPSLYSSSSASSCCLAPGAAAAFYGGFLLAAATPTHEEEQEEEEQRKRLLALLPTCSNTNSRKAGGSSLRRAVFNDEQRRGLEQRFRDQKYINKPERKKLAEQLGLRDSQALS